MTLEERIRTAIKSGNLLYFSLNREWTGVNWRCSYRNADNGNVSSAVDPDPIVAIEKAMKPLRSPKPEPVKLPVARQVKRTRRTSEDLI